MMKNKHVYIFIFFIIFFSFKIYHKYKKKNNKTISILCWYNSLEPSLIKAFEEKTGFKVFMKYYSSNEELISKLSLSKEPIDVIFPSDYTFNELTQLNLIQPIDFLNIESAKVLLKELLSPVMFKNKYYGVPREWGVYGLVVNKKIKNLISEDNLIYKSFFEGSYKKIALRLASDNDIPTITNLIYYYYKNFFKNNKIDNKNNLLIIIYEILKKQKKNMLLYSDNLLENLFLDDIIDIAILQSDRYLKMINNNPNIELFFILSSYYNLKIIEYAAIPKSCKQLDIAYQFINFIMEKDVLKKGYEECFFFPARKDLINELDSKSQKIIQDMALLKNTLKKTEPILDKKESTKLWMKIKS